MRLVRWERYVPDFDDNRARHARGEPALVVEVRAPSAGVWRRFAGALYGDPARRARLASGADTGEVALFLAQYDDALTEMLWRECIGGVDWPAGLVEGLAPEPTTGAELWALRHRLDDAALYTDLVRAIIDRAELEKGLAAFLASRPSLPVFPDGGASRDGIATSVGPPA